MERFERLRFHRTTKIYFRKMMRISIYSAISRPLTELLGVSIIGMAALAGGYLVLNQKTHLFGIRLSNEPLDGPSLLTFYALLIGACDPARKMTDVLAILQAAAAGSDRVFQLLDREPSIQQPRDATLIPRSFEALSFERVSFHYVPDTPVLQDVSAADSKRSVLGHRRTERVWQEHAREAGAPLLRSGLRAGLR